VIVIVIIGASSISVNCMDYGKHCTVLVFWNSAEDQVGQRQNGKAQ